MKYKVGDKVRYKHKKFSDNVEVGEVGTICGFSEVTGKCGVAFETKDVYKHSCSGLCNDNYGWWCDENALEPVISTLAEIKENNLRCVIKVDSKEEAVKLFEIFNPNDYDVNYIYDYLMSNYWKGDGTVCFGVVGNQIDGFDTETYYKKNEEQYGKIYRFKDLVAKGGIVTLKPRDESMGFESPYLDLSSFILSTNSREFAEKISKELAEHFNAFPNGFRGGKKPEYVLNEKQAKEYADNIIATAESISHITGIPYENSINKLKTCLRASSNDGISAKNGGKNSMKFTFYVTEGYRIDKSNNTRIPTMTTEVLINGKDYQYGGSATCDKTDYEEREGVLNAIANAVCGGNFDREFNKVMKNKAFANKKSRKQRKKRTKLGTLSARRQGESVIFSAREQGRLLLRNKLRRWQRK